MFGQLIEEVRFVVEGRSKAQQDAGQAVAARKFGDHRAMASRRRKDDASSAGGTEKVQSFYVGDKQRSRERRVGRREVIAAGGKDEKSGRGVRFFKKERDRERATAMRKAADKKWGDYHARRATYRNDR